MYFHEHVLPDGKTNVFGKAGQSKLRNIPETH